MQAEQLGNAVQSCVVDPSTCTNKAPHGSHDTTQHLQLPCGFIPANLVIDRWSDRLLIPMAHCQVVGRVSEVLLVCKLCNHLDGVFCPVAERVSSGVAV
jgi:hypothetical protein